MATAGILYQNLADACVVTASSWVAAAPPSALQNRHVTRRTKGRGGDTEWYLCDLGSAQSIDVVCLFGLQGVFSGTQRNLSSAATTRLRISSVDATGAAGDLYDSASDGAYPGVDADFPIVMKVLTSAVNGRYVRLDVSEAGATELLAGRLVIGLLSRFEINFQWGWSQGYGDLSRKVKSAGGQTFVEEDDTYRVLSVTFGALRESEARGFVDAVDRLNGIKRDVLLVIDPASTRPAKDSIWGLPQDLNPITNPNLDMFGKSYVIEERR